MMDRSSVWTEGRVTLSKVMLHGHLIDSIDVHVLSVPPAGVDVVLGLDTILRLGMYICNQDGLTIATLGGDADPKVVSRQVGSHVEL